MINNHTCLDNRHVCIKNHKTLYKNSFDELDGSHPYDRLDLSFFSKSLITKFTSIVLMSLMIHNHMVVQIYVYLKSFIANLTSKVLKTLMIHNPMLFWHDYIWNVLRYKFNIWSQKFMYDASYAPLYVLKCDLFDHRNCMWIL